MLYKMNYLIMSENYDLHNRKCRNDMSVVSKIRKDFPYAKGIIKEFAHLIWQCLLSY